MTKISNTEILSHSLRSIVDRREQGAVGAPPPRQRQRPRQEATPGRRNIFHRSIRSKPKLQLLFALAMQFRIVLLEDPVRPVD